MAVTVQSFKQFFPEFRKTEDATIAAKLAGAQVQIATTLWGAKTDLGTLYLTAHMTSLSPAGQNAKLSPKENAMTVYGEMYEQLKRQVTMGFRTAGTPQTDGTS